LTTLSKIQFPDFESFKADREKTIADAQAPLQKNVAFPELSESLLKGLEELSTKMQLKFNVSAAGKEKEQLLATRAKKILNSKRRMLSYKKA